MVSEVPLGRSGPPAGHAVIAGVPRDPDTLLAASRRLDWRFLLPNPQLGQVAYVGPAGGSLREALEWFSDALTIIEVAELYGNLGTRYETAVVSAPSYEVLNQVVTLIKPGGFLYIEAFGRFLPPKARQEAKCRSMGRGARPRHPEQYRDVLEREGLAMVRSHWHWPNFESCTKIIPLEHEAALRYALWPRRRGIQARLLHSRFGRCLLRSALPRIVPCFSIVACRISG
ncbi:MAG: hypothetical protein M3220_20830 [Chloroflexota bacterium]|nr:hypothetical protein [Chloroflexota bacterium]